jgi:hypothetical protein
MTRITGAFPASRKKRFAESRAIALIFIHLPTQREEPMITWAAVVFAIAALGGATLATMHFRGRTVLPMPLALLHGLLAATGLVLLIAAALTMPGFGGMGLAALVIFLVAALGGFYLFAHTVRGRRLPSPVVLIHGGAAVVAFLLLLGFLFNVKP